MMLILFVVCFMGKISPKSITTKVGDKGTTFLFSGEEVPKNSERIDAYGDLDELVSVLGVARSLSQKEDVRLAILEIQRTLFVVGSELATAVEHARSLKKRIDSTALQLLETKREALEARIEMPSGFIVPGGTPPAAHLDHARTLARRCERKIVGLAQKHLIQNAQLLIWMNRLSDYLWLLARFEEGDARVMKDE